MPSARRLMRSSTRYYTRCIRRMPSARLPTPQTNPRLTTLLFRALAKVGGFIANWLLGMPMEKLSPAARQSVAAVAASGLIGGLVTLCLCCCCVAACCGCGGMASRAGPRPRHATSSTAEERERLASWQEDGHGKEETAERSRHVAVRHGWESDGGGWAQASGGPLSPPMHAMAAYGWPAHPPPQGCYPPQAGYPLGCYHQQPADPRAYGCHTLAHAGYDGSWPAARRRAWPAAHGSRNVQITECTPTKRVQVSSC